MPRANTHTVLFPHFAKIPKRDPITHNPIPEVEPDEPDTSAFEYVEIPSEDIFGKQHQGIILNGQKFERGETYFVEPDVAAELRRLIAMGLKADMRILQSHPDTRAVKDQQRGTSNPKVDSTFNPNVG